MSQISRAMFGAAAVALTLGAVPLAAGRDVAGGALSRLSGVQKPAGALATTVNRAVKADRAAGAARSGVQTQTISLKLNGLSDTSVLVRMPVAQAGPRGAPAPSLMKSGNEKSAVACEPAVSVLTEVARLLQPGRCVT